MTALNRILNWSFAEVKFSVRSIWILDSHNDLLAEFPHHGSVAAYSSLAFRLQLVK